MCRYETFYNFTLCHFPYFVNFLFFFVICCLSRYNALMLNVDFVFELDDKPLSLEALADNYEVAMLFEHTQEQVRHQVLDRLGTLRCPDHGQPPRVTVKLAYSEESGQTDLSYHVDACCQRLLLQAVSRLHH
jgi:hypothetical protein